MSDGRASLFGQEADLDLSGFKPKASVKAELVRDIAAHAGFRSREPGALPAAEPSRAPRRYRTGRNTQLNLKLRREAVEAFYKIADEQGWVLGEAFEHAVSALQKALREGTK